MRSFMHLVLASLHLITLQRWGTCLLSRAA